MSELDAMLAAVRAEPGDDTVRLVLADWLEEHATEESGYAARASFIRCQIAAVRCPRCNGTNSLPVDGLRARMECWECAELRRREEELFKIAGKGRWFDTWEDEFGLCPRFYYALPHFPERSPNIPVLTIARGFPARYRGPWEAWQAHADVLLADPWVPGLDEVELTTEPELLDIGWTDHRIYTIRGKSARPKDRETPRELRLRLLELEWPGLVRSWKLPPEPRADDWRPQRAPQRWQNEWPANYEGRDFTPLFPPEES